MRRNRRTRENGARVAAVKLLHATAEGRCAHCDVLAPCPTQLALDFATVAARAPEEKRRTAERIADDAIRSMHRVAVSHPSFALTDKDHSE